MAEQPASYYSELTVEGSLTALGTTRDGLQEAEAGRRLQLDGPNKLPKIARRPWYLKLAQNFIHLFALLLWVGAVLAWLAGLPELSWAIIIVIVVNGFFSYWQEYQAERAADALEALLPRQVTVRRAGEEIMIPAESVVRGDILILIEGEAVPADARVFSSEKLRLDLSSLTGESRPVPRSAFSNSNDSKSLTSLHNLVFAGTNVAGGRGEAVVFSTGGHTEFGRIARLTQEQTEQLSPLQRELQNITRVVALMAVGLGASFFVVGYLLGGLSFTAAFIFAVGIIVAIVPEGLLPTLTLSLALGVRRMAVRKALVKRLSAVEALGATTVILTDKTGTLTENEMTVRELWLGGEYFTVTGGGYEPVGQIEAKGKPTDPNGTITGLLRAAALCCDAHLVPPDGQLNRWTAVGDPTEAAILTVAAKAGLSREVLKKYERLAELPFDSTRKRMTTIQRLDGAPVACVKGALHEVISRCTTIEWNGVNTDITSEHLDTVQAAHDQLAGRGLRLLAVATRSIDEPDAGADLRTAEVERDLTLIGLIAMEDPPRPEIKSAIAACRQAGIRVVMITGDDGLTASAIGREIGMHKEVPRVITGAELDILDENDLITLIKGEEILFARVAPEQKLKLVETFQHVGEVVAVTGDGVNDAPALKRADIGIAMGATGTDVAREASDMILTDDNFASIVAAIEEGRAVYDNIRKFVIYIFASNAAEMMPFVLFVLFPVPLPLTIMQVLAVDVGTDIFPALGLGAERPEPDVMQRRPRKRSERLLDLPTLVRAFAWLGMIEAGLSISAFFFVEWMAGWRPGLEFISSGTVYLMATTATFAAIVMAQVGNAFACRTDRQSVFKLGLFSNHLLLWGIAAELCLMMILIYVPPVARIFNMSPLGAKEWLLIVAFGIVLLLLEEGRKFLARQTHFGRPHDVGPVATEVTV